VNAIVLPGKREGTVSLPGRIVHEKPFSSD